MRTADLPDSARLATLVLDAWDAPSGIDMLVSNVAPKRKAVTALAPDDAQTAMRVNFYDGSKASAVEVSDGIIAALDTDTFEHYIQDIEAVVDFKNSDTDTYVRRCGNDRTMRRCTRYAPSRSHDRADYAEDARRVLCRLARSQ